MPRPVFIAAIAALAHAGTLMAQATTASGVPVGEPVSGIIDSQVFDALMGNPAKDAADRADGKDVPKQMAKPPACARPDFGEPGAPGTQACPAPAPKPQ